MNWTPWALFAAFVAGLVAAVLDGVRRILTGRLIPRHLYDASERRTEETRRLAETALEGLAEANANNREMSAAVRELTASVREAMALLRHGTPDDRIAA
jgi:hypothetical protein